MALRAESSGRINVRVELIDDCALSTLMYEDEGLLINGKKKKKRKDDKKPHIEAVFMR